jgi:hypothetical protein
MTSGEVGEDRVITQLNAVDTALRFEHRYADSYHVRFKRAEWGGLESDTLVIVANIPLERGSPGYDEAKVLELEKAVSKFVKAKHSPYANVEFIEKMGKP